MILEPDGIVVLLFERRQILRVGLVKRAFELKLGGHGRAELLDRSGCGPGRRVVRILNGFTNEFKVFLGAGIRVKALLRSLSAPNGGGFGLFLVVTDEFEGGFE